MKAMIEFVIKEQKSQGSKASILDRLEALYCLTDQQAHEVYEAADNERQAELEELGRIAPTDGYWRDAS